MIPTLSPVSEADGGSEPARMIGAYQIDAGGLFSQGLPGLSGIHGAAVRFSISIVQSEPSLSHPVLSGVSQ
jgi:hypothetical protein